jgi:hypothetical protein
LWTPRLLEQFGVFPDEMGRFSPLQWRDLVDYVAEQDRQAAKAAKGR